ncbi:helicase RepA family protein [Paracoccus aminovorans]|uniref:helicase RepA family protein n=1 Tax=Paracoccus aminovorans TaxID=34004 RepID=UPI002B25D6E1|nr:helicase RepA family protein [Paracoccus aminovorans]
MSDPRKPTGIDGIRDVMAKAEEVCAASVSHLFGDAKRLKPRAQAILDATTWAGNIAPCLQSDYLVKGWLNRSTVSVVYGPSNVGKSFLAVDLAHHISKGIEWGGRRVTRGRVLYIAAEGGNAFRNRVAALDDPEFFVLSIPLSLTGKDSAAVAVSEVVQHLGAVGGAPFDLIVIDTMARVMGGLDENAAPDIADLIRNLDLIRRVTGAHVMLVHHTGKDTARGARGHSSLRAAIDTEIELSRDDMGQITAEVTKQRDGPTGYRFSYRLRQVELGLDQDGDPVTTCLVEPTLPAEAGRAAVTEAARKALSVLDQTLAAEGEVHRRPQYPGGKAVPLERWREACLAHGGISASDNPDTLARTFRRCRDELEKTRIIVVRDDLVWRVE